jgi:hypothetical protein
MLFGSFVGWCIVVLIQDDRKFTQSILDTCFVYQKINYIEIRKQRTMFYQVLEMSSAFTLFLIFGATR